MIKKGKENEIAANEKWKEGKLNKGNWKEKGRLKKRKILGKFKEKETSTVGVQYLQFLRLREL